jgi:hypothetical protein
VSALLKFVEGWWWLVFIFGGGIAGGVREAVNRHHRRRLAILEAKTRLRGTALPPPGPPEPQPVCGCTHHLSFHNPKTSICAYDDCRCQQYIGPEPLGHIIALPLVDPGTMGAEPQG